MMADREYTIVGPDGRELTIIGPDNATADQLRSAAERAFGSSSEPVEQSKPSGIGQTVRNVVGGLVRGAGSIGATLVTSVGPGYFDRRSENVKAQDEALADLIGSDPESFGYRAGKVGAEIAGTASAGGAVAQGLRAAAPAITAAPRIANIVRAIETGGANGGNLLSRTVGGVVSGGASTALVNPENAGLGAAIGGASPTVIGAAGRAGSALGGMLRPNAANNALADKAINTYGIPLGVADISDNALTKATRSVLNDAPITGGIGAKQREAVQAGYNKAVGGTFGAPEASLTAAVMDRAKQRLGAEFDRIWNSNALQVDAPMFQKLTDLQTVANKLPANEGGALNKELQDLLSKMQPDARGALVIPGDVANRFQSYIRRRAEGTIGLRNELGDLRQTIISAFNRSVSPADAQALTMTRGQYKAFKTVEPLLNSSEAGVAGRVAGDVPAGLLPGAVLKSYGNAAGTDIGDLSQIGSRFVADRVARTGGSSRAMVQNSMVGGALGAGAFTNPALAAGVVPTAAGINWLLGNPALARKVLAANGQSFNALSAPAYRSAPVLIAGDQ